uniref:GCV_T domain-containing protein n=1 Tax=Syphacia muris TaxID=451379 RepID=A0A0N5ARI8_9BILA
MSSVVALSHRLVLKLTGSEVLPYLQRLITADVELLSNKTLNYAFLLNARGRIVEDIFLLTQRNENHFAVLLECGRKNVSSFFKLLKRYVMHKDVCIEITDYNAYFVQQCSHQNDIVDPRVSHFGGRVYSKQTPDGEVRDLSFYHNRRYEFGIPEGEEIYGRIPVFCNGDLMSGISSNKGCYVGQETTTLSMSNMVRQRIVPFICTGNVSGCVWKDDGNVGSVVSCDGNRGLAIVKTEIISMFPVKLNTDNGSITLFVPDWWPISARKSLKFN